MALYLGGSKVRLHIGGIPSVLNLLVSAPSGLRSSDGYILKDSNGFILLPAEPLAIGTALLSSDDRVLTESNGLILTI